MRRAKSAQYSVKCAIETSQSPLEILQSIRLTTEVVWIISDFSLSYQNNDVSIINIQRDVCCSETNVKKLQRI